MLKILELIDGIDHHWFEAFHVIAVISWIAGLLYLPRIFAYHAQVSHESECYPIFCTMERRLLYYIMNPAMTIAVFLGLLLAFTTGHIFSPWLHVKLVFVSVLVGLHFFFWRQLIQFRNLNNKCSPRFYKIINEAVTVSFVVIVIMAIVKPFR